MFDAIQVVNYLKVLHHYLDSFIFNNPWEKDKCRPPIVSSLSMMTSMMKKLSKLKTSHFSSINSHSSASPLSTLDTHSSTSPSSVMRPSLVSTVQLCNLHSLRAFLLDVSPLEPWLAHFYLFSSSQWPAEGTFSFISGNSPLSFAFFHSSSKESFKFKTYTLFLYADLCKALW
jgi:hypothetical protein